MLPYLEDIVMYVYDIWCDVRVYDSNTDKTVLKSSVQQENYMVYLGARQLHHCYLNGLV